MKTSIEFLPKHKQEELKRIVEYVANDESMPVHMIILFGSYARGTQVEDKYQDESGTTYEYQSDFDLLFLMSKERHAKSTSFTKKIREKIKENCNINTRLSTIFHGIDYFNGELRERNYFFIDIYNEGILIYDSETRAIIPPPEFLPKNTRLMKARHYYNKWLNSADEFFRDYKLNYNRKQFNLAIFHLHQTCEHLYMGIHLVFTDYKPKSHDLIDLDARAREFNENFSEAFPCRTKEEELLFKKLKDAYIDSRYEKDYVISIEELDYFEERAKTLQKLAEKLCKEFLIEFAKQIPDISDDLMEKIKNTDASTPGFYHSREIAQMEEQKAVKTIEDKKESETRKEIALKMLKRGLDSEAISDMTGLSVEEIEELNK